MQTMVSTRVIENWVTNLKLNIEWSIASASNHWNTIVHAQIAWRAKHKPDVIITRMITWELSGDVITLCRFSSACKNCHDCRMLDGCESFDCQSKPILHLFIASTSYVDLMVNQWKRWNVLAWLANVLWLRVFSLSNLLISIYQSAFYNCLSQRGGTHLSSASSIFLRGREEWFYRRAQEYILSKRNQ